MNRDLKTILAEILKKLTSIESKLNSSEEKSTEIFFEEYFAKQDEIDLG